jgi:hypothetical protein
MLEEIGFTVTRCEPASGYWRQKRADVFAWEFHGYLDGRQVISGCWETMTECVKAGALEYDAKLDYVYPKVKQHNTVRRH